MKRFRIDVRCATLSLLLMYILPAIAAATTANALQQGSMARTKSFHGEAELPHHDDEKENWLKFYVNPYSGKL
jgi:hypothetical protein